jgi:hypothetical protein
MTQLFSANVIISLCFLFSCQGLREKKRKEQEAFEKAGLTDDINIWCFGMLAVKQLQLFLIVMPS